MRKFKKLFVTLSALAIIGFMTIIFAYVYMYLHLPDVETLKNIQLQVPLRIYTSDKKLIAQYGEKRRTPVPVEDVPKPLVDAILATEDQRYYDHPGVDLIGLTRAVIAVVSSGRKSQGASTITMQVARNFFLTRKKTYSRKINEILLAIKIDAKFSKQKILELYLNKIYLGHRAYGVAAAARVYYGKQLNELTIAQMAMVAGLPQAPSRDNPISNPDAAKERRDHVLYRMLTNHTIDQASYQEAISAPITARYHETKIEVYAPYMAEMVREAMLDAYGEKAYTGGYNVLTTLDSRYQLAANNILSKGLEKFDRSRGYRGAIAKWSVPDPEQLSEQLKKWMEKLAAIETVNDMEPAVVLNVEDDGAMVMTAKGEHVQITMQSMSWARKRIKDKWLDTEPKVASDVVHRGDVIRIRKKSDEQYAFVQLPDSEGALVALNPKNGAILALVGGYSFKKSHFNRATQAKRQPGSSFKPFIYSAALAKGFTLASVINDAPIVTEDSGENELWRPHNANEKFYGPTRLRDGLVHSRNVVTIRLLQSIGIEYALNYINRFGFNSNDLPHTLSLALGSSLLSPLQLTTGYSVFANGGYKVMSYYIDRIEQDKENVVYQEHPLTVCEDNCQVTENPEQNFLPAPQVITPQNAYLITNTLQDVIIHGTGRRAKVLRRPDLAGKTGTTNKQVDAWFAGFTPNIVTTVWVGFDHPKSLRAYAAQTALPIWIDFMRVALRHKPIAMGEQPASITHVKIDPRTGLLASPGQKNAIFEIFRQKYAPTERVEEDTDV